MIRVTIELISANGPERNRILGIAEIHNDGSSLNPESIGHYNFTLGKMAPKEREVWKRGRVVGFPRKGRGAWDLLYRVLKNSVAPRNP